MSNWHIGCICAHLEWLLVPGSGIDNLIINIPFRFGKSLITGVSFFGYAWAKYPGLRFLYTSHSDHVVSRDQQRARKLVGSDWYRKLCPKTRVDTDKRDTDELFHSTAGGFRYGTTIFGGGFGEGADVVCWDDPLDPKQARSDVQREAVNTILRTKFLSRFRDPRVMKRLGVMQRLHGRDATGAQLMDAGEGWHQLVLPMRYEPKRYLLPDAEITDDIDATAVIRMTPLQIAEPKWRDDIDGSGRSQPGDLLFPTRFPENAVSFLESQLGDDGPGQLQQRPSPAEGGSFGADTFRRFGVLKHPETGLVVGVRLYESDGVTPRLNVPVDRLIFFQTIDTALTANTRSAYTAVVTHAAVKGTSEWLVWHAFRAKLKQQQQWPMIKALRAGQAEWDKANKRPIRAGVWPSPLLFQAVEKKASGYYLLELAVTDNLPLVPLEPDTDKVRRSLPAAELYAAGKVYHPRKSAAKWVTDLESELIQAPNGPYMDWFDCIAYGGILFQRHKLLRMILAPKTGDANRAGGVGEDDDDPDRPRPLSEHVNWRKYL